MLKSELIKENDRLHKFKREQYYTIQGLEKEVKDKSLALEQDEKQAKYSFDQLERVRLAIETVVAMKYPGAELNYNPRHDVMGGASVPHRRVENLLDNRGSLDITWTESRPIPTTEAGIHEHEELCLLRHLYSLAQ
jgi:hypothetical protein